MSIFNEVNRLSESDVLKVAPLTRAADGKSYVCPNCGHGTHGDGIKQKLFRGQLTWHCYGCGTHFSNADLIATVKGINPDDKAAVARCLTEMYPEYSDKDFFPSRKESARRLSEMTDTKSEVPQRKNYSRMYEIQRRALPNFLATQPDGKWRGLTQETLQEAGVGYNAKYKSIVLPYDENSFFWRSVEGRERGVNKGGKRQLYIALPIQTGGGAINFITEGEIDALSIKQAIPELYRDMFGVVATGSAGFARLTVEQLNQIYGNAAQKPKFIWLGDNDAAGFKAAEDYVSALNAAGYPAVSVFFEKDLAGTTLKQEKIGSGEPPKTILVPKVDANSYLQEHGEDDFWLRLFNFTDRSESALKQRKQEIATRELEKKKASVEAAELNQRERDLATKAREEKLAAGVGHGIKIFSLREYSENQFDADVSRLSEYRGRRTGFDNLDSAQIFLPGLYVLGGTPGAGKTTFVWQLLEQLAEKGETCLFCSYEMSAFELFTKSVARGLRQKFISSKGEYSESICLPSAQIRFGALKLNPVANALAEKIRAELSARAHVAEVSNTTIEELIVQLKEFASLNPKSQLTVAIDYLQLIPIKNAKATTKERVDEIMRMLKTFQREVGATIILISSLNRGSYESDNATKLSAFKESGLIEYSADVTWHLICTKMFPKEGMPRSVVIECTKNRNGAIYKVAFDYYAQSDCFLSSELTEKEIAESESNSASEDKETKKGHGKKVKNDFDR